MRVKEFDFFGFVDYLGKNLIFLKIEFWPKMSFFFNFRVGDMPLPQLDTPLLSPHFLDERVVVSAKIFAYSTIFGVTLSPGGGSSFLKFCGYLVTI
jgi:hypothetical protein